MPASLESKRVSQVTSRLRPSLYSARTGSCCSWPGCRVRCAGSAQTRLTSGSSLLRARRAGRDPVEEQAIFAAAFGHQLAALVRRLAERLAQQQAVLGRGGVDAPAVELARQPVVIHLRGVAAQRQAEAVLPGPLAVAGALVAAEAREERLDVVDERRGLGGAQPAHRRTAAGQQLQPQRVGCGTEASEQAGGRGRQAGREIERPLVAGRSAGGRPEVKLPGATHPGKQKHRMCLWNMAVERCRHMRRCQVAPLWHLVAPLWHLWLPKFDKDTGARRYGRFPYRAPTAVQMNDAARPAAPSPPCDPFRRPPTFP